MNKPIDIISTAQDLIQEQLDALNKLKIRVDKNFNHIVNLIFNCSGRLIIIGLGKSGIIGKKITATLNSTGTVSSFIHASDALHGDLGNINNQDIVLFISQSGNTQELKQIIPIIKNRNLNIIGMTGNLNSYLAKNANFTLDVSIEKEACPNNLAPTTSTTMQLVMGDAVAISLLRLRNFSKEDFARFHPGGSLGKQLLLKVRDICDSSNRPKVSLKDNLEKIIMEISSKRLGATAVIDGKKIIGIITDGDLRRMLELKGDINSITAKNLMSVKPKIIERDALASQALSMMKLYSITQLLVTDSDKYVGIIHLHDILKNDIF